MGLFVEWAMMPFDGLPRGAVQARFGNEGLRGEVEVDGWLDDIGLDYVTIFAGGKAYTVERKAPWRIS